MLELNRGQKAVFADKLADAANMAAGALIFGQFLSEREFSVSLAFCGLGIWVLFMGYAIGLITGDRS